MSLVEQIVAKQTNINANVLRKVGLLEKLLHMQLQSGHHHHHAASQDGLTTQNGTVVTGYFFCFHRHSYYRVAQKVSHCEKSHH